jgi:protein-S-isoprenylcysteine O-methyltransferase Ste14
MANGRVLRRLRRFLPYPLVGAALLWLPPMRPFGSAGADQLLDLCGLLVALAGEGLRFWTWGANADAGLFSLRSNGPYQLLRHPLYVGNFLIVLGMLMILNNPVVYLVGLPAFAILYNAVARKEEGQILAQSSSLTPAYRAYLAEHPNRFLPQLSRWREATTPAHPFRWWVAIEKEYEAVLGVLVGWIALDIYEEHLVWRGQDPSFTLLYFQIVLAVALAIAAVALYLHKKRVRVAAVPPPPEIIP